MGRVAVSPPEPAVKESLLGKILSRTAVVGVVGLGYVGLPFAVEKAKVGFRVIGIEENPARAAKVNRAENYIRDVADEDLQRVVAAALGTPSQDAVLERVYPGLPRVSVDYGLMERADNVAVVPLEAGWDDVGTWPVWARHMPFDGRGNVLVGRGVLLDSEGCIVRAPGRLVAALGVRDLISWRRTAGC